MRVEMSHRFLVYGARLIELGKKINGTFEGQHIYRQLFRSGTSAGANYEESHSAESTKDFLHKRQISLKELRESLYWLKLIEEVSFVAKKDSTLKFLLKENDELIKILAKSISTTKRKNI
jgi:four helix bundle protein